MSGIVRESDIVSRLGGDEFVVVLQNIKDNKNVTRLVENIVSSLAAPYFIETLNLETTPSIGISLYPGGGHDGDSLIRNADSAMYKAKAAGRKNFRFFEQG